MDPLVDCPDTYRVDNMAFGAEDMLSTYLLDADRPVALDAGTADGAERILAAMDDVGIDTADVAYVAVSHVHLDHAAGTSRLLDACENATALVHERGVPYLTDSDNLDRLVESVEGVAGFESPYGDPDVLPDDRVRAVSGGETIDLGDRTLDLYDAPGHAPHHYVAFEADSGMLFAADAVGGYHPDVGVMPTTPPPDFDLDANLATADRLGTLDPDRILYSHVRPGEPGAGSAELERFAAVLSDFVDDVAAARDAGLEDLSAIVAELSGDWPSPMLGQDVAGVRRYLDETD
jgi:glyoxylase-like metal-dependent hydrolase (beta-lactamase superfamily II)